MIVLVLLNAEVFMEVRQNANIPVFHVQNQNSRQSVGGTGREKKKNENPFLLSAANLNGESFIQQRQRLARNQARRVVLRAFSGEKKLDDQMQSIKEEIARLRDEIKEKTADTMDNDARLKELQDEYNIDPDSKENQDLKKLAFKATFSDDGLSEKEIESMSEYQKRALLYVSKNLQNSADIRISKALQEANVQAYSEMNKERDKSQDMRNAREAAEDIMEASNGETIALLRQEAVEHAESERKEREEKAKEIVEKKKEEKKEEAKKLEKEAAQQEVLESIKEHAGENQDTSADVKRAIARRKRTEADDLEVEDVQRATISDGASMDDTQDAVNSEIKNILNKLSLLSEDVKGSSIDSQI